jgi:hypothetical protein
MRSAEIAAYTGGFSRVVTDTVVLPRRRSPRSLVDACTRAAHVRARDYLQQMNLTRNSGSLRAIYTWATGNTGPYGTELDACLIDAGAIVTGLSGQAGASGNLTLVKYPQRRHDHVIAQLYNKSIGARSIYIW